ncbi:MAG: hypothetical protein QFE16_00095 [Pseudomonadota bacterium]|nr:hypothetical protein [Pseudomonadota bacterium]
MKNRGLIEVALGGLLYLASMSGASAVQPVDVGQPCACGSGTVVNSPTDLASLLGNKTVCASVSAKERWQELHGGNTTGGGLLTDYKRGPSDSVDKSKVVGSWSIVGNGANTKVHYDYGAGGTYEYTVCQSGSTLNFCGARNITNATLSTSSPPCGF